MMKMYEEPYLKVMKFSIKDIITMSEIDEGELGDNETDIG